MKFLLIFIALTLSSCARVSVVTTSPVDDTSWEIHYLVWFRDVEDVTASVGDVSFGLGSAGTDVPISNDVVACLLSPHLCK